jgi:hypothetical protein
MFREGGELQFGQTKASLTLPKGTMSNLACGEGLVRAQTTFF